MFRSQPFTSACTHEVNTCGTCLNLWLDERLTGIGWDQITCPECSAPFQYADVVLCATRPQFERYDKLLTRATLSAMADFYWCLSPQCESGQFLDLDNPMSECRECGFRYCTRHGKSWHDGATCDEYDRRSRQHDEEEQTREVIERTTKKCPGCEADIEKNGGCNHMTCMFL